MAFALFASGMPTYSQKTKIVLETIFEALDRKEMDGRLD